MARMNLQRLLSYVRRACDDYEMIKPGDKIVAALSGGKDSLAMLAALAKLRDFYPRAFSLEAITVDLGFSGFDAEPLAKWCGKMNVAYRVLHTDIGKIVFDERAEKNPCSLCSKMRKGALNKEALRIGGTRVAYGHNRDDIIHTFFMSLFLEGRLHKINPVTYLDRTGLYAIRPLMLVPEQDVSHFAKSSALPVIKSPCPADGLTKRAEIKEWVAQLRKKYAHLETKVFNALLRAEGRGL